jgi:hypothetical protein
MTTTAPGRAGTLLAAIHEEAVRQNTPPRALSRQIAGRASRLHARAIDGAWNALVARGHVVSLPGSPNRRPTPAQPRRGRWYCADCHQRLDTTPRIGADGRCQPCRDALDALHVSKRARRRLAAQRAAGLITDDSWPR